MDKNGPKIVQKWSKNVPNVVKNGPKIVKIWSENGLKMRKMVENGQKMTQNGPEWAEMARKYSNVELLQEN